MDSGWNSSLDELLEKAMRKLNITSYNTMSLDIYVHFPATTSSNTFESAGCTAGCTARTAGDACATDVRGSWMRAAMVRSLRLNSRRDGNGAGWGQLSTEERTSGTRKYVPNPSWLFRSQVSCAIDMSRFRVGGDLHLRQCFSWGAISTSNSYQIILVFTCTESQ